MYLPIGITVPPAQIPFISASGNKLILLALSKILNSVYLAWLHFKWSENEMLGYTINGKRNIFIMLGYHDYKKPFFI